MEKDALPLKIWAESFPRSDTPPNSAEVKNWPYPQFAQKEKDAATGKGDWDPLNKEYDIEEMFPRSKAAPESAEVKNWPFPQHAQKSLAQEPSPDIAGLPERFNRPEKAPTKPEVLGWPTAKEIAIA